MKALLPLSRLTFLAKRIQARRPDQQRRPLTRYQDDPVAYIHDILHAKLWSAQEQICRLLLTPPHKVLVKACHSVGKSWLAAALICWHYDCFDPSLTISTAPTAAAVRDQLWRELRILRTRAGLGAWRGPSAPELASGHDHWAKGFTAASGEAFQGRHQEHMLFVVDEGVGVPAWVYDVIRSMFQPGGAHHWLCIGNPTDTASPMYAEDCSGGWHTVTMSALDHPNLMAGLAGRQAPYPSAVSLGMWEDWLVDWTEPIPAEEATALDIRWPPQGERWYRPGPLMESRGLGRWPSAGTYGVWSDALWQAALVVQPFVPQPGTLPQIGADIARFGDDYSEFSVRWGAHALHHERHNGWSIPRSAGRLVELARTWLARANALLDRNAKPLDLAELVIAVDDGGVGGGVTDLLRAAKTGVRPIIAQAKPCDREAYDNARSELWFNVVARARRGELCLAGLDAATLRRLRIQAMAPLWAQDAAGRRVVEPKHETKERLSQGSPDGMDALNLAFYNPGNRGVGVVTGIDVGEDRTLRRFGA